MHRTQKNFVATSTARERQIAGTYIVLWWHAAPRHCSVNTSPDDRHDTVPTWCALLPAAGADDPLASALAPCPGRPSRSAAGSGRRWLATRPERGTDDRAIGKWRSSFQTMRKVIAYFLRMVVVFRWAIIICWESFFFNDVCKVFQIIVLWLASVRLCPVLFFLTRADNI